MAAVRTSGSSATPIAAIGDLSKARARTTTVDATGLAVAPGFINMLSWATDSLIEDGKSQSDMRQGVTTRDLRRGRLDGAAERQLRKFLEAQQTDIKYEMPWTTLGEYLAYLEKRGISPNVASYIGATTLRTYVIGFDERPPTAAELDTMRELVRQEMEAGALGIGSVAHLCRPAIYASTEELIELCKVAAKYEGKYISHMRSEADALLEAVDELIRIGREAGLPAEIYHLKAAGEANWPKMDQVIAKVDAARRRGPRDHAPTCTRTPRAERVSDACDAAVGARRRRRRSCSSASRIRTRGPGSPRDEDARQGLGEPLPPDRGPRERAARRRSRRTR